MWIPVQAETLNSCIGRGWRQRLSNVENTVVRKDKAYLKDGAVTRSRIQNVYSGVTVKKQEWSGMSG